MFVSVLLGWIREYIVPLGGYINKGNYYEAYNKKPFSNKLCSVGLTPVSLQVQQNRN
ncbi:hypothetical protein FM107_17335 [Sphingobacterium sp. JB170]|nr:hypothetical protein FM107_17335 [Sphingobacterium sp. JB170]